ncbi:von Willebrand factor type A domain-containing protein [Prosthecobacter fusiformis]|uniref:von Willebrand factor type A domain-containing protein n=1 Tax=Prosthecobacter fusiformis TaxID=48464 RepID=A0A4R7RQJ7_9BACT|nr:vWA domain-containing protein [Prosthecobacter fusiformis]TDU67138.1 von Willebrand factor type A domain-containing protein [Prosthecobacter fusiformis]
MNLHLTEIAYILDRSGSMQPMQEPAIAAFNDFVKSQLDVPGDARLTLIQFDDAYEVPIPACPIQDVPQLTAATYIPRGSTALLDAIGRTIQETDRRIQALPESSRPGKVILAIFTDGQENASHQYTTPHISDLIRLYRDQKNWDFLFLAANQDAIATAASLRMDISLSGTVDFTPRGMKTTGSAMARKIRSIRMKASGQMDAQAQADDTKTLEEIVQEEEKKPQ